MNRFASNVRRINALAAPAERTYRPVLVEPGARPGPSQAELEIWVRFRNDGTVYGDLAGTIALFDPAGRRIGLVPFNGGRILPGATREVAVRWPLPDARGQASVLALPSGGRGAEPAYASAGSPSPAFWVRWNAAGDSLEVAAAPSPAFVAQNAEAGPAEVAGAELNPAER